MAEWFANARMVDVILGLVLLEAALIALCRRLTGRGPRLRALLPTLVSGFALLLALRGALLDDAWPWLAAALTVALSAHLLDLFLRYRP